ncbi:MAG: helicase [Bifidobacteriaceae bacterium]|jgi:hypothetical protein|nr:helicase [Bifidobacteriaceae bacterium]
MLRNHWYLRFHTIAAESEGGGSDEDAPNESSSAEESGNNDSGSGTDWKSKYEEMQKHSRTWEKRAEANKTAVDELEKLKASQKSKDEETEKLRAQVEETEAAKQRSEWAKQVSEETGVPANALKGSTLEELQEHAEVLKPLIFPTPKVGDPGKQPDNKSGDERGFLRKLLSK